MIKRSIVVTAVALAAAVVTLPLAFDQERRVLEEAARAAAPGRFIPLTDGVTHYRTAGAHGDPPVVLVHGFNGPMTAWNKNVDALAGGGSRVVAYDLYGRGWSDRPDARYDL